MKLFLDTSALVARHNRDDAHHEEALKIFERISSGELAFTKLYCSDYVFDEATTTCLARTRNHGAAVELGEALLRSKSIVTLRVDEKAFSEAWNIFKKHGEIALSFTDCTTVALARRNGILSIFTFDREFDAMGLHRIP